MKLKLYVEGSMILGIAILLFVLSNYARHALDWTMAICCILMTGVFFVTTFRKIQRHIKSDMHYLHSIGVLFAVTLVYMAGYSVLYYYAGDVGLNHFGNLFIGTSALENYFDAFYLSVVTFTSTGYGDITAESHLARLMLMCEMLLGFGTSVFAISIFASLVPND